MAEPKCPRCMQWITPDDTLAFEGNQVFHLDCNRPRDLSPEERVLLSKYCGGHAVAVCRGCVQDFRQFELGSDSLGNRSHFCPRCRADLTAHLREHLYSCVIVPSQIRVRARAAREAAKRLVKKSSQLRDLADVLMREAEASVAALRETMRRTA